jgi:hypothetical protein
MSRCILLQVRIAAAILSQSRDEEKLIPSQIVKIVGEQKKISDECNRMVIGEDHVNQLSYQTRCKYFLCNRTRNEHLKQAAKSNFAAVAFNDGR